MISKLQKILGFVPRQTSRILLVIALAAAVALTVSCAQSMAYTVRIQDGKDVRTVHTLETQPEAILMDSGYVTDVHDEICFTGFRGKEAEVSILRAFPVAVYADGKKSVVMTTGDPVEEILQQANVDLNMLDAVNIPLTVMVAQADSITVTRNEVVTFQKEVELPCDTMVIPTSLLPPGTEKLLAEGYSGLQLETYEQPIVNGEKQEPELLEIDQIREPLNRRLLVGERGAPISDLDFGYAMDDNGEPLGYVHVLRNQRAAGYSAKAGAQTASGLAAVVGHVAVDPAIIPYGSKLYIRSADGSFVYGYAIAADTGTAIADGRIAVDLFYGTYAESAWNGIKYVDIFVLE